MDLELDKKIKSRLNDPQKVVVVATPPRMSFYEYWLSVKPLLERPEPIIIILDDIRYKVLKRRIGYDKQKRYMGFNR